MAAFLWIVYMKPGLLWSAIAECLSIRGADCWEWHVCRQLASEEGSLLTEREI
jgi:hypothetical protein